MPAQLPNFLIVGAMRAGTTSLWHYLRSHPQVHVAPTKELNFFDQDRFWSRGAAWYAEAFAGANGHAAVGEASPSYMFVASAPERMSRVVPDARLIAILRNPVDRAHSHYWHARHRKGVELRDFEEAVAAELDPAAPGPRTSYLARGRYLEQLSRLCEHYPRESILVLLLDDLDKRPRETYAEVCRFLEIDDSFRPDNLGAAENAYLEHRAFPVWRLMRRHRLWRFVPWRETVARSMLRLDVEPPAIEPALRARLVESFSASNRELAQWIGRDLSRWSSPEPSNPRRPGRPAAAIRGPIRPRA